MSLSYHLGNLVLDCIFGKLWYCPQTLWLGLFRQDPLYPEILSEPWFVAQETVVPEGGGWYWFVDLLHRIADWFWIPEGTAWDRTGEYGSYLMHELFNDPADKPFIGGGFRDLTSEEPEGWQVLSERSGYARVETKPGDWLFASDGVIANDNELVFPAATLDWGTLTHFALFDTRYMTMYGELSSPKEIIKGQYLKFEKRQLEIFIS